MAGHAAEIHDLTVGYGDGTVLSDVDLSIETARRCACWAATAWARRRCIKTVMGLLQSARAATIVFEGRDITRLTPNARARLGIGYVPQGRLIFPQLTVTDNLLVGLEALGGAGRRGRALGEVLRAVPGAGRDAANAGGHALGRTAAAAGDRPRADWPAAAAAPGRADGGHPAVDRAGDSARAAPDARSSPGWPCCLPNSSWTSPTGWPTTYCVLDGGVVALREQRRGDWIGRRSTSCSPYRNRTWSEAHAT